MRRLWLAALILCALPACGGRYGWIGTSAQAPFRRCVCSHPNCTPAQSDLAEEYADAEDRSGWLARQGCDPNGFPVRQPIGAALPASQQRCWDEPQMEQRVVPRPSERVAPACEGCSEQMLCTNVEVIGVQCRELSAEEWAQWREARTEEVEVGSVLRCEGVDVPSVGYNTPRAYDSPSHGGGAVHVRGYYRRDGTYVRPHTRRRPR